MLSSYCSGSPAFLRFHAGIVSHISVGLLSGNFREYVNEALCGRGHDDDDDGGCNVDAGRKLSRSVEG